MTNDFRYSSCLIFRYAYYAYTCIGAHVGRGLLYTYKLKKNNNILYF